MRLERVSVYRVITESYENKVEVRLNIGQSVLKYKYVRNQNGGQKGRISGKK